LDKLPIELIYYICDFLSLKDVLKLRLVNRDLKTLIDSSKNMWVNKVAKIEITLQTDLAMFLKFMKNVPGLRQIQIDCPNVLSKKQLQKATSITSPLDTAIFKDYSINIKYLNSLSFNLVSLFSNEHIRSLRIDSFVNTFGQIKASKYQNSIEWSNSFDPNQFMQLECFDLTCLYFDLKTEQYFIWNHVFKENCLLNSIHVLFKNLVEIHLRYYFDSLKQLIKCVRKMKSLRILEIDTCNPLDDFKLKQKNQEISECELRLEKLFLHSIEWKTAFVLMNSLSLDCESLQCLSLFLRGFKHSNKNTMNSIGTLEDEVENDLFKSIRKFSNLKCLSTNLFNSKDFLIPAELQSSLCLDELYLTNEPSFSCFEKQLIKSKRLTNLKRLNLLKKQAKTFDMEDLIYLIENFPFDFKYLNAKVYSNCVKYDEFRTKLKNFLNTLAKHDSIIQHLERVDIKLNCQNSTCKAELSNLSCRFHMFNFKGKFLRLKEYFRFVFGSTLQASSGNIDQTYAISSNVFLKVSV